jgi:hypothetical protein
MTILAAFTNKNSKMTVNIMVYSQHFFVNKELNMGFYNHFEAIIISEQVKFGIYFYCLKNLLIWFFYQLLHSMVLSNCFIKLELHFIFQVFILEFFYLFFDRLMKEFAF